MNDGTKVEFFGGKYRKALLQIKPHLVTEYADSARPGPVGFLCSVIKHMFN
jgi:hypothetical protein